MPHHNPLMDFAVTGGAGERGEVGGGSLAFGRMPPANPFAQLGGGPRGPRPETALMGGPGVLPSHMNFTDHVEAAATLMAMPNLRIPVSIIIVLTTQSYETIKFC